MLARLIPTQVHGVLDYAMGVLLIISPWLFGFSDSDAATWIAIIVGAAIIVASLVTDYELSLAKIIPMRAHLGLDILSGAFLAVSPWLFGFADENWWFFMAAGIAEVGAGLFTDPEPEPRRAARGAA